MTTNATNASNTIVLAVALLMGLSAAQERSAGGEAASAYSNPLDFKYDQGETAQRREVRDPCIIREGDTYYLVFTMWPFSNRDERRLSEPNQGGSPGIALYSSKDLKTWAFENWLVKSSDLPDDCPYKNRFWAPEIHKIGGKFYVIFTADNWIDGKFNMPGKWGSAGYSFIGVADKVTGPYRHIIYVEGGTCDMTLFADDDGRTYAIKPKGDVFLQQIDLTHLDKDEVHFVGREQRVVRANNDDIALKTSPAYLEGPWLEKIGRQYCLFYAALYKDMAFPDQLGYRTGVAYADSMAGPWRKDARGSVFFGGHLAVFDGPDGRKWFSYRNEQDAKNHGLLCIDPIDLDAEGHVQAHETLGRTGASPEAWRPADGPLMTRWAVDVSPAHVLPEYPRPQMVRKEWQNLNGLWDYAITPKSEERPPAAYDGKILVPYPIESALSGVKRPLLPEKRLWYRRTFSIPQMWRGRRILLHFGAVDWESEVFINGRSTGVHKGGYDPFSFDITPQLRGDGPQELIVRVYSPLNSLGVPRGKQTLHPQGFTYTASSGIWQPAWLEPVHESGVKDLRIIPDVDASALRLTVNGFGADSGLAVSVTVKESGRVVQTATGIPNKELLIPIDHPRLWSPDDPFLYDLQVELLKNGNPLDEVSSYFGMRKINIAKVDGVMRPLLNGKFVFQMGVLDQGFWPDGIYTAPTDEALRYDLEQIKAMGFNMVRSHIKVERERWYFWADKLGLLIWQDMPCPNGYMGDDKQPPVDAPQFETELRRLVETHWNHPSVIMWVLFNEGEGQQHAPSGVGQQSTGFLVKLIRDLDPSRLINEASGGLRFGVGDVLDFHSYPEPPCPMSETQMTAVGEYGGIALKRDGHLWNPKDYFGNIRVGDADAMASLYHKLAMQILAFKSTRGLGAAVYTQITDVELECNGLLTYDRIPKLDAGRICKSNQSVIDGQIELIPVLPTSEKEPQLWKYTRNDPPENWTALNFEDGVWDSGQGGKIPWPQKKIWLRKEFNPGSLSAEDIQNLNFLVYHDEDCELYINGILAAKEPTTTTTYVLAKLNEDARKAIVPGGRNLLAVHCIDREGGRFIDAGIYIARQTGRQLNNNH